MGYGLWVMGYGLWVMGYLLWVIYYGLLVISHRSLVIGDYSISPLSEVQMSGRDTAVPCPYSQVGYNSQ